MTQNLSSSQAMPTDMTIEWAPFTVAEGVDEATLYAASTALQQEFLSQQLGFIRRELLKGTDNQWCDLVYWESRAAADQASQNASNSPVCYRYFTLMQGTDHTELGAGVLHFQRVKSYE